jgi:hypothetical protein
MRDAVELARLAINKTMPQSVKGRKGCGRQLAIMLLTYMEFKDI